MFTFYTYVEEEAVVTTSVDISESLGFFSIVCQVTLSVSSISESLKLYFDFCHVFIGPSDVIPLAVSDVRHSRRLIYFFDLSLRFLPCEFVALHLP